MVGVVSVAVVFPAQTSRSDGANMKIGDWVKFRLDGDIGQIVARSDKDFRRPWEILWPSGVVTTPRGVHLEPAISPDSTADDPP